MTVTLDQIKLLINEENKLVNSHFDAKFDKLSDKVACNEKNIDRIKVRLYAAIAVIVLLLGGSGVGIWKVLAGLAGG